MKKNGAASATGAGTDYNDLDHGTLSRQLFSLTLGSTPTVGDTITFSGLTEGTKVGSITPTQSVASSSCVVGLDATSPVITMRVKAGNGVDTSSRTRSAGTFLYVSSSEKVSISSAAAFYIVGGTAASNSVNVVNLATGTSAAGTDFMIRLNESVNTTASATVININPNAIKDTAGNAVATTVSATAATDSTAPVITVGSVSSTASAQAKYIVGSLQIEAKADGTYDGAAGSSFTLKVTNQRGLELPTVAVDTSAKTIVVTADTGYHTVSDVARAALNAGVTHPLTGQWKVTNKSGAALTDKVTSNLTAATCGSTCGESRVTVTIDSNEAATLATAGVAITVDGLGTPFVTTIVAGDTDQYSATDDAVATAKFRNTRDITFKTKRAGSATMSFTGDADGVNDVSGNNVVLPVTFTVS